ncbi:serine/threonine-protein kinase/endoribonuclease IRE1a-like [Bidens hawaiensis]|uniref:serine/threonine-protein kinase/endoribonuclease IRE1a-like n=1 Tax=Bidens hawaiensis TaxID=980011 RepID=UPI00404B49A4
MLCDYDFHHLVKNEWLYADLLEENGYPKPYLLDLMRNIVDGLQHLHARRIIYGDLNPSHVLIHKYETSIARLSVVGTCRRLAEDETSLRSDDTVSGTPGWRTPEQILNLPQTPAMDVFNLGCVLFFLLTRGKHPFGESENNVAGDKIVNLSLVEHIPEAMDLISRLLKFEPQLRPKVSEVPRHPLFWDSFKRMSFLRYASVRVNGKKKGARYIVEALERDAPRVFSGTFNGLIGPESIAEMEYNQQFSRISVVRELLHSIQSAVAALRCRALENKDAYLADPFPTKCPFDDMLEELDHYLRRRFPNLLMAVYDVMLDFCKEEDWIREYLPYKRIY